MYNTPVPACLLQWSLWVGRPEQAVRARLGKNLPPQTKPWHCCETRPTFLHSFSLSFHLLSFKHLFCAFLSQRENSSWAAYCWDLRNLQYWTLLQSLQCPSGRELWKPLLTWAVCPITSFLHFKVCYKVAWSCRGLWNKRDITPNIKLVFPISQQRALGILLYSILNNLNNKLWPQQAPCLVFWVRVKIHNPKGLHLSPSPMIQCIRKWPSFLGLTHALGSSDGAINPSLLWRLQLLSPF